MPTEIEFEEARVRFETAADETEQVLVPVRQANGADVLTGGALTADVDLFIDTTGSELAGTASELRALADECARRAEECRQAAAAQAAYLVDVAAYEQANAEYVREATQDPVRVVAGGALLPALTSGPAPVPPTAPPSPPPYVEI